MILTTQEALDAANIQTTTSTTLSTFAIRNDSNMVTISNSARIPDHR